MGSSLINLRIWKYHFMFLKKGIFMKQGGFQVWRFYISKNSSYEKSWKFIQLWVDFK